MASQNLKHRPRDDPTAPSTTTTTTTKNRKAQKLAMAKRGVRSLAIAIAIPFILAALSSYASCTAATAIVPKAFWRPPVWAIHLASISTSCLMGLSAWLVWAEGGFHSQATTLPLFLAQFLLGLFWGPLVFRLGATRVGLVVCIILLAALFACSRSSRRVNPIAGNLMKLCLAWVSFLAVFNYTLV
ncbi:translocator protein homolog [Phoenix dactylifera]|uniref:Translocator protein homolog n=1 Tax=Phoenix dactylifera TaxID=42345 RepID=A0A8B7CJY8_PHODC|nr:translocator protein homolog [Phoenix dactylifera]